MTLTPGDVAEVEALIGPPHLTEGSADFLSYSYILVLGEGRRLDLHTAGLGTASLMRIEPGGGTQYVFSRDGLRSWMAALDAAWERRAAP